jgi:ABC-2 type transport system permease protein
MSGLFPNVYHVARREYITRVRGRAFVITSALLALAVLALMLLPSALSAIGVADPVEVAVVVEAEDLPADPIVLLQTAMLVGTDGGSGDPPAEDSGAPRVERVDDAEEAADAVRDGEYDALLSITRDDDGELAFEFLGSASPTNQTRLLVTQAAFGMASLERLERAGVDQAEAASIFAPPTFTAVPIDPEDARNQEDFFGAFILAYAVVILTFMAILTYGNWVAQSVAEEKSGRVMEMLITAATPRQLLIGKVLGTGAAGLSQYLAVAVAALIGYVASGPVSTMLGVPAEARIVLPALGIGTFVAFALFFLLGFLLYSTLYAAAGSMVSRVEDAQQAAGPLIYVAVGGYLASTIALNDPDASWAGILALVPFFSPYLMPARILLSTPSIGEVLLALVLLALTVAGALAVASRIYAAGVLLYGQRVGLRSIWRATRVSR